MGFRDKKPDAITEADLQELVESKVREGKSVDYKETVELGTDSGRKEFLADVSSFANAAGGHLFLGIREEGGEPVELRGMEMGNSDDEILRLENLIRDGIEPRLSGLGVGAVTLKNSRVVVIVKIPRSFAAPHMVTLKGHSKFYSRNSAGKYQMDVFELRSAFVLAETSAKRIRDFRLDRIAAITAGNTPITLGEEPKVVLHLVPLSAFDRPEILDLRAFERDLRLSKPITAISWDDRYNFDGFVTFAGAPRDGTAYSFVQFYRNGIIEAADGYLISAGQDQIIPSQALEGEIVDATRRFLGLLSKMGVEPPFLVMLTLVGVLGYRLGVDERRAHRTTRPIDRDILLVPDLLIEEVAGDIVKSLKPIFDAIWNASGWPGSANYDDVSGDWAGSR